MGSFEPTDSFKKYIKNGQYEYVRMTLGNLIFADRNFSKNIFDDALEYVTEQIGDDIYEKYNMKGLISKKKSSFIEDDFEEAVAELSGNFCRERIEDVKKISNMVYNKSNEKDKKKLTIISKKEEKITPIHWAILAAGAIATIAVIITVIKVMKK